MIWKTMPVLVLFALAGCGPKGAGSYNKGVEATKEKKYSEAKAFFEEAVQKNPDFAEAWYNLGFVEIHLSKEKLDKGKRKEALALFRKGIDHKDRAKGLMEKGKFLVYKEPGEQKRLLEQDDLEKLDAVKELVDNEEFVVEAIKGIGKED